MKYRIITSLVILCSLMVEQSANAGIISEIGKLFGIKEDSTLGQLTRTADDIGNAIVAKKINDAVNNYAPEQVSSYGEWANEHNDNQDRKVQQYLSDVDQFKMDYCKSHGFYDLWYSQYGDAWFDKAGRDWFDKQDDLAQRRTGDRLLPWHLRDSSEVIERASNNKVDTSLTNTTLGIIGMSNEDVQQAEKWIDSDKYGKRDMIIDRTFDVIAAGSDNKDMVNAFRRLAKINNQYVKDKTSPKTSNIAMHKMANDLTELVFDTYSQAAERKKAYLNEKLQIRKQLERQGIDPSYSDEIAGTILSINNNKDLTDHEKKEWLRFFGFYGKEDYVLELSESVSQMTEEQAGKLLEEEQQQNKELDPENEIKESEEDERQECEKDEAIFIINKTLVDSYNIDETRLNDAQKKSLTPVIDMLNKYNELTVEVIGYTCDLGSDKLNDRIGMKRAESVKTYLVESGIEESRISTSTRGENDPEYDNTSDELRMKNRRVKFTAK